MNSINSTKTGLNNMRIGKNKIRVSIAKVKQKNNIVLEIIEIVNVLEIIKYEHYWSVLVLTP